MRLVLETLRKAGDPMTAKEIALVLMERKGFDGSDERTMRLVEKRVFMSSPAAREVWLRGWCMGHGPRDGASGEGAAERSAADRQAAAR